MEPNYELIVKDLFDLSKDQKVQYADLWELSLTNIDSTLGKVAKWVHPEYHVPEEVSEFIHNLVEYVEKNHIKE